MPTEIFFKFVISLYSLKSLKWKKNEKFYLLLEMIDWRYDEIAQNNENHIKRFFILT